MPEIRVSEKDICDFCSDPTPVRIFSAPDFMLAKDSPGLGSRGGWMACADCGALIDAGKWVALQLRATDALAKKYLGLLPRYAVEKQVVIAHNLFREHMRRDV